MKIVILDGQTLNPGDLSWEPLEKLADGLTIYPRTPPSEIIERARGAELILTNKTPLSAETIGALPSLRYIGVLATGYNIVDTDAAARRGIPVTNVPTYGTRAVAELVFAHILNFTRAVSLHAESVRRQDWAASEDFCYWNTPQKELYGSTLGIIGLGKIGLATARLGVAFGMRVLAYKPSPPAEVPPGIEMKSMEEVFRQSDYLSLHCPLTEETHHLINTGRLDLMKPEALLINTGRGQLVDEEALATALAHGRIAGAALDVLSQEPPPADHPLTREPRCMITPHLAWAARSARERLLNIAVENLQGFLEGNPTNLVNHPVSTHKR